MNLVQRALIAPINVYRRYLSRLKPAPTCRFHPSCSLYAVEAISRHGALKGLGLALWRLCKCHPFHPGGFDPVPPAPAPSASAALSPDRPLPEES